MSSRTHRIANKHESRPLDFVHVTFSVKVYAGFEIPSGYNSAFVLQDNQMSKLLYKSVVVKK